MRGRRSESRRGCVFDTRGGPLREQAEEDRESDEDGKRFVAGLLSFWWSRCLGRHLYCQLAIGLGQGYARMRFLSDDAQTQRIARS